MIFKGVPHGLCTIVKNEVSATCRHVLTVGSAAGIAVWRVYLGLARCPADVHPPLPRLHRVSDRRGP
jgi:hypothetical protein